jgi:hypothetical protein
MKQNTIVFNCLVCRREVEAYTLADLHSREHMCGRCKGLPPKEHQEAVAIMRARYDNK